MTDLSFDLNLKASIDGLAQSMTRNARAVETAKAREPVDFRFQTSAACPSGGPAFVLNLGGPDPGFYWHVRRVTVGGLQWGVTAAGTGELYVTGLNSLSGSSGQGTVAQSRSVTDLVDEAQSLPSVAFYGQHEVYLQAGEVLAMVIVSGSDAQTYTASVQAQAFRTIPASEAFQA